jgi:CRP-like cAMP-binding protein
VVITSAPTTHPVFAQAPVFAGLGESELALIAAQFRPLRRQRDDLLLLEGSPAEVYYLIAEGRVKIIQASADGEEVILHILGPGELVGALPNLNDGTYPASAAALGDVLVYAISPDEFEVILRRHPAVAINLLHFAAAKLRSAHDRLRELTTERVERRIARTLTRLARQIGRKTEAGVLLDARLSRQDLAELSGTSLFTVSRTLKDWERRGLVEAGRERIVVRDSHGLMRLAEDLPSS